MYCAIPFKTKDMERRAALIMPYGYVLKMDTDEQLDKWVNIFNNSWLPIMKKADEHNS